jgi:hypothetical protein
MNTRAIKTAKAEAKRFLNRVREYEVKTSTVTSYDDASMYAPAQSGALRRASLDLTRALAAMRRYS